MLKNYGIQEMQNYKNTETEKIAIEFMEHCEKETNKLIESKCKETAKNVRHKACDIVNELCSNVDNNPLYQLPSGLASSLTHNIMNIQENDVIPK